MRVARALVLIGFVAALALPSCTTLSRVNQKWWELRRDSSGQAPDPATTPEPVIQVYAARTVGWRGLFAVHTWIAVKPAGAPSYSRYEVIGWGVKARDLLREALEAHEDRGLADIAEARERTFNRSRALSHADVWKPARRRTRR